MQHKESSVLVYTTKDYSLFKHIKGNRNLNLNKIKRIKKEVLNGLDMLKYNPILVSENNNKLEVIDGQHRFEVCKELGSNVWYIVCATKELSEIAKLNSNNENWKNDDYIKCFAAAGNKNYILINEIVSKYKFPFSQILAVLFYGRNKTDGGLSTALKEKFKEGNFEVKYYEVCEAFCKEMTSWSAAFKQYASGDFVEAVQRVKEANKVNYDEFKKRVIDYAANIPFCRKPTEYLHWFEIAYNVGKSKRVVIY